MTALLAVEFEPESNTYVALRAIRRPGLVITSMDAGANEAVASVEVQGLDILDAALAAVCSCTNVRSGTAFPSEA